MFRCAMSPACPSSTIKGTVQRDFLTPVFFIKRLILVSKDVPESDFEVCRIFVEIIVLKGTVQRDFLTPVFFTKWLILASIDMPKSEFEIFRIFAELFELKL